jgi:hypothetical protein
MKQNLRLIGGFVLLIVGTPLALLLPEFGVPLVLLGTRLLGVRYKWAKAVNSRVDKGWAKIKAWFKRVFHR